MTDDRRRAGCVLVINVEPSSQPVTEIAAALEPIGIPIDVVDSGRQLRWANTLVVRVPPGRAEEAILALELRGFGNVLAYESGHGV
jgi:hypothetical protein